MASDEQGQEPQDEARARRARGRSGRMRKGHGEWFAHYWRDWMNDPGVRAMTPEERGLLMDVRSLTQATKQPGIYTEDQCRRWAGYSIEEWSAHREPFLACHLVKGKRKGAGEVLWVDPVMRREALAVRERLRKARESGKRGAQKVWRDRNLPRVAMATAMAPAMHTTQPHQASGAIAKRQASADACTGDITPSTAVLARELLGRVAGLAGSGERES